MTITGAGEAAIKVWYLNHNAMAFMTVPYPNDVRAGGLRRRRRGGTSSTSRCWPSCRPSRVPPSAACDDATFLRRAYLDTIGTLPTADEARAFLADTSADKRDRLIDSLLTRPEFVDYWTYKWSDLLLLSGERLRPKAIETYYQWIRQSVAENKPWDQFVREIVTATRQHARERGGQFLRPAPGPGGRWPRRWPRRSWACRSTVPSATTIRWKNGPTTNTTRFANMFSRVRAKGWGGDYRNGDGLRVVYSDTQGELIQPSRGAPQPPAPLDGAAAGV